MVPSRGQSIRQIIKIKIEKLYFRRKTSISHQNYLLAHCPLEGTIGVSRTTKNTAQKFVKICEICV